MADPADVDEAIAALPAGCYQQGNCGYEQANELLIAALRRALETLAVVEGSGNAHATLAGPAREAREAVAAILRGEG